MNFTLKLTVILLGSGILFSCSNPTKKSTPVDAEKYSEIKKADWLIGKWENKSPEGVIYESWEKRNDSVYIGKGYFIDKKDTVITETIRLEQQGKNILYIPVIKNENNEQAVIFKMTYYSENQLIFENPEHDFPQKITYTQTAKDSLLAEISGTVNGKQNSQKFPMQRIK